MNTLYCTLSRQKVLVVFICNYLKQPQQQPQQEEDEDKDKEKVDKDEVQPTLY